MLNGDLRYGIKAERVSFAVFYLGQHLYCGSFHKGSPCGNNRADADITIRFLDFVHETPPFSMVFKELFQKISLVYLSLKAWFCQYNVLDGVVGNAIV